MSDLLPWNATLQERALSEAVARVGAVQVPVRDVWNADVCPPNLLPWLAWSFSVDQWDNSWTDAQKRAAIKASVPVHRYKGTVGAVQEALAALSFSARVQEWFAQSPPGPAYTFRLLLEVGQIGIPRISFAGLIDIIDRTKSLRSHLSDVQLVVSSSAGPYLAGAASVGSEIVLTNYEYSAAQPDFSLTNASVVTGWDTFEVGSLVPNNQTPAGAFFVLADEAAGLAVINGGLGGDMPPDPEPSGPDFTLSNSSVITTWDMVAIGDLVADGTEPAGAFFALANEDAGIAVINGGLGGPVDLPPTGPDFTLSNSAVTTIWGTVTVGDLVADGTEPAGSFFVLANEDAGLAITNG